MPLSLLPQLTQQVVCGVHLEPLQINCVRHKYYYADLAEDTLQMHMLICFTIC